MHKLLFTIFIFIFSCSHYNQTAIILTDEDFKFDISDSDNFRSSIIKHFDYYEIAYKKDLIIVDNISEDKSNYYKNIINNNKHIEYISNNPSEVFNLIYFADKNNDKVILDCINSFLRFHSVKNL